MMDKSRSVDRARLTRAMTVPNQEAPPLTFGIQFAKNLPSHKRQATANLTPPGPTPQASAPASLGPQANYHNNNQPGTTEQRPLHAYYLTTDAFRQHNEEGATPQAANTQAFQASLEPRWRPLSSTAASIGRPGSVLIPRKTHLDTPHEDPVSYTDSGTPTTAKSSTRVRFVSPSPQAKSISLSVKSESRPMRKYSSPEIQATNENGTPRQLRAVTPQETSTTISPISMVTQTFQHTAPSTLNNLLAYQSTPDMVNSSMYPEAPNFQPQTVQTELHIPNEFVPSPPNPVPQVTFAMPLYLPPPQPPQQQQQPLSAQPQFAVIAQDSSALQALLSGDLGGRTYIIQTLPGPQQPYYPATPFYPPVTTQYTLQMAPQPLLEGTLSQPLAIPGSFQSATGPPQGVSPKQEDANQPQPSPPVALNQEIPEVTVKEPSPTHLDIRDEVKPRGIAEPVFVVTSSSDTQALDPPPPQPPPRSPGRSLQSIFKPEQHHPPDVHKIAHRQPQKLATPAFLKPQTPSQSPLIQRKARPTTHLRLSPLAEYAEKLKTSPAGQKRSEFKNRANKFHSMPESENLIAIAKTMSDKSVISVIDRARLWQEQLRAEDSENMKRSGFVDRDLVECGDELVPVEERVRAFDTGQVVEESAAASKLLNDQFEEERNRRIQEQSFNMGRIARSLYSGVPLNRIQPPVPLPASRTSPGMTQVPTTISGEDTISRLAVQEKSNLIGRRTGGGRLLRLDRATIQRRKTQPITFDDIARANQSILDSDGSDSPIGSCKDEDVGSFISSPTVSVLSDFSEMISPVSTKPRSRRFL